MDYNNKPSGYYTKVRHEMAKYLPSHAKVVIDIGCGNGAFGQFLKENKEIEIWGIEYMDNEAQIAKENLYKVFSGKCEDYIDELPDGYFDAIYFNDVLEHLVDPFDVLDRIKNKLSPKGVVISSIPNIRSYDTLMKLFFRKDFKYEKEGILDNTHMRFFTKKSIRRMYENLDYEILVHEGINKTKSIRPILFNIPLLFTQMDVRNLQYATVATYKNN